MGGIQEWRVREPASASVALYLVSSEHHKSLVYEDILLPFPLLLVIIPTVQGESSKE